MFKTLRSKIVNERRKTEKRKNSLLHEDLWQISHFVVLVAVHFLAKAFLFDPKFQDIVVMKNENPSNTRHQFDLTQKGSRNCAHGDERARNVHAEIFACTKLRTRKSVKTLLSSTRMLFKVVSCFCV